ncbi:MAG TPA: MFS transporter [Solirubrobacteraceae bacterium]|nr:MFS transporter [Solirubrobacteraceae bacterium]
MINSLTNSTPADGRRTVLILAVLAIAGTTFALLQAIVVPALPVIGHALGATPSAQAWILTANLLSTAVLTPLLGRAGDIAGKDRVLTGTLAALGAGTLICALAPSLPVMLAGRVIQGAGGAIYPLAFGIVRDELPRERIPGAIGLVSSLVGIGAGLGLVIPGFILEHLSYQWLFWLPLGVIAATIALTARCVPPSPIRTRASINWLSAALMAAGLAALLVAVSEASAWGWASPATLGLLAAGAAIIAAWVAVERRAAEPLVDMRVMATRGVWTANVAAFLLGVGMYASIAIIPALVELPRSTGFGFGGSPVAAGLFMLPTAAVQLVIGPFAGRIERRLGSRMQLLAGMVCVLIGYLALVAAHATTADLLAATVVLGLGLGLGLSSLANLIVQAVTPEQTGVATGFNTVMRTLGGAFGAQLAAGCIAASAGPGGLPTDRGFTAAFAVCALALAAGVISATLVPRRRAAVRRAAVLARA